MDVTAEAIIIFVLFSIFTPISLVLTSKTLRRRTTRNAVKDAPYESAEASVGGSISVMKEYLHYFSMFLAYEIIVVIALVWAAVARSVPFTASVAVLSLLVGGIMFEGFALMIARKKDR